LHHRSSIDSVNAGFKWCAVVDNETSVHDNFHVDPCKFFSRRASSGVRDRALEGNAPSETAAQSLELASFFHDAIFVMTPISLTGATLSDRIYKICTPLSTGFVENLRERATIPPREAWPGAGFRGTTAAPSDAADDATAAGG